MTDRIFLSTKKRTNRIGWASLWFALSLLFSLSTIAFAQGGSTITGRVSDEQGAIVVGAEVRLRSRSGLMILARTDERGVYGFNGLGPGEYILEVTARGFAAKTSDELRIAR